MKLFLFVPFIFSFPIIEEMQKLLDQINSNITFVKSFKYEFSKSRIETLHKKIIFLNKIINLLIDSIKMHERAFNEKYEEFAELEKNKIVIILYRNNKKINGSCIFVNKEFLKQNPGYYDTEACEFYDCSNIFNSIDVDKSVMFFKRFLFGFRFIVKDNVHNGVSCK